MIGILDPVRYAAVYAKVHARLGQLLSPQVWNDLLAASDLPEFIQILTDTPYQDAVEYVKQARDGQGEDVALLERAPLLERALRGHLAHAFLRPLSFVPGKSKDLLMWRWRHFELDNLKTVLRAVAQEVAPERARATLVPLGTTSALSWDSLVEVESVVSVVERLADTFYGEALKPALDRYRRGGPLLVLEVRLDLAYYRRLLAMIQGLSGRDRKEAERFLGTLIDSQNVLWAFRYRIYYGLSPEEILNYTLHRGIEIDATTIRAIAEGAHVLEVLRQVWDGRLSNLERLEGLSDEDALDEAERLFDRYLFEQAQRVRNKYAMHLGIVLSYEVLLETEVYDLVSIAEGKVANWSAAQIRPYLITPHN